MKKILLLSACLCFSLCLEANAPKPAPKQKKQTTPPLRKKASSTKGNTADQSVEELAITKDPEPLPEPTPPAPEEPSPPAPEEPTQKPLEEPKQEAVPEESSTPVYFPKEKKVEASSSHQALPSHYWEGVEAGKFEHGGELFAEFLYWKVSQEATDYVLSPFTPLPANLNYDSQAIGTYKLASLGWEPAFRVGLSYTFKRDSWKLSALYTYFHDAATNSQVNTAPGVSFTPGTFPTISSNSVGVTRATSHIHLTYETGDLMLSHRMKVVPSLLINVGFGVTGALIKEHWHISYQSNYLSQTKNNWNFQGLGARTTVNTQWHLGAGFELLNTLSIGALVGPYHNKNRATTTPVFTSLEDPLRNTTYKNTLVVPTAQFQLGLNWSYAFPKVCLCLGVAGEANIWVGLQQVFRSTISTGLTSYKPTIRDTSNITLYGGNAHIGIRF